MPDTARRVTGGHLTRDAWRAMALSAGPTAPPARRGGGTHPSGAPRRAWSSRACARRAVGVGDAGAGAGEGRVNGQRHALRGIRCAHTSGRRFRRPSFASTGPRRLRRRDRPVAHRARTRRGAVHTCFFSPAFPAFAFGWPAGRDRDSATHLSLNPDSAPAPAFATGVSFFDSLRLRPMAPPPLTPTSKPAESNYFVCPLRKQTRNCSFVSLLNR